MFPLLFHHILRKFARYFSRYRTARIMTVVLFLLLLGTISAAIFSFFFYSFRFLILSEYFKDAILLYLFELFLFIIFILIFVSALITGLFSLFTRKNQVLLATSPRFDLMPILALTRMFISSLWPILIIVLPALVALSLTYGLSLFGAWFTLLALSMFIAFAVVLSLSLILLITHILYSLRYTLLRPWTLAIGTVSVFALLLTLAWHKINAIHFNTLFTIEALENTTAHIDPIRTALSSLPSHPLALAFFAASHNDIPLLIRNTFALAGLLACIFMFFLLLKKRHLTFWQHFQGNQSYAQSNIRPLATVIEHAHGSIDALFRKELAAFFRNARSMTWFGFFCLIWLFQSGSTFILNHQLSERPNTLPFIVLTLQVVATIYFVNMFVLRFAFPSFSMEQKTRWIMQSAPVDIKSVFFARAIFYAPLFSLLGLLFSLLNAATSSISPTSTLLILSAIFIASITVTLYGLALGALFPNLETDDPESLSTSLTGLTFIFTSTLYGGCMAIAIRSYLVSGSFALPLLFLYCSILISILSIIIPVQYLRKQ